MSKKAVKTKLTIMICTLWERITQFNYLEGKLINQTKILSLPEGYVEIIHERDAREMTVGKKRNILMQRSKGEYVCFVDDDDDVSSNYIKSILNATREKPDCIGFGGRISTNGVETRHFEISLKNDKYWETPACYYRPPLHLTPIKREIAIKYPFPEVNQSEDTNYAMQMIEDKALKTEVYIDRPLYFYYYDQKRSATSGRR